MILNIYGILETEQEVIQNEMQVIPIPVHETILPHSLLSTKMEISHNQEL